MKSWSISLFVLVTGTTLLVSAGKGAAETIATIDSIVGGQVSLNRASWQDYQPVQVGDVLEHGDFIFPEEGVAVSVACENGDIWFVPDGITSLVDEGCSKADDTTSRSGDSSRDCGSSRLSCLLRDIFGRTRRGTSRGGSSR